jgi:hypothetical protein
MAKKPVYNQISFEHTYETEFDPIIRRIETVGQACVMVQKHDYGSWDSAEDYYGFTEIVCYNVEKCVGYDEDDNEIMIDNIKELSDYKLYLKELESHIEFKGEFADA